jgi:hypothetical protein
VTYRLQVVDPALAALFTVPPLHFLRDPAPVLASNLLHELLRAKKPGKTQRKLQKCCQKASPNR